jgi:phospholipid transport system substrate-binding protein
MMSLSRRAVLAGLSLVPMHAWAQAAPMAIVESFNATLLNVMRNARQLGIRGREQTLRPAMDQAFNLPAMARISVGPPWTQLAPQDQQAIIQAFSTWSVATFANRFDNFSGERFVVEGEAALQNGDRLVQTKLVRPSDAPVQLNYLMRDFGGQWRAVDIYLTGTISELATRRAEFTGLLRQGGAPALISELNRRTATLLGG